MLVRNSFTHDSRVEKEAATLVGAGYAVTVVAEAAPGVSLNEDRDGYIVRRVERPLSKVPGLRLLAYLKRFEAALLESAPDILHAHDSDAVQPVARAARKLDVPFVYDAHELWLGKRNRGRSSLYFGLYLGYYGAISSACTAWERCMRCATTRRSAGFPTGATSGRCRGPEGSRPTPRSSCTSVASWLVAASST